MKLPKARRLPSGSWFVRVQVDGKTICITKPTRKEAEAEAAALKSRAKQYTSSTDKSLSEAIDDYIASRENILSPSTIAGYRKIQKRRFKNAMNKKVESITPEKWQGYVNAESKLVSAKTLKNAWGFVSSVIAESTGKRISVRLPQVISQEAAYLSSSDLKAFLDAAKGNPYEIAILLGLSGLRRSEILGLRWDDIDLAHNCINVRGAAVMDIENNLVHKAENKNSSSRRCVPFILPQLRQAIQTADKSTEYVVNCYPNTINVTVQRLCKKAGIPKCTCHGLRKSFASMMLVDLHLPEDVVMKAGGWSDPHTMRKIYTQVSRENLEKAGTEYEEFFSKL